MEQLAEHARTKQFLQSGVRKKLSTGGEEEEGKGGKEEEKKYK